MEGYFVFYHERKEILHPMVLSAEMHERLVTIHPFLDGNGRTARLVMNLILLQHGYPIANIKGDAESKKSYYASLEKAQTQNDKNDFIRLIAKATKESLEKHLSILSRTYAKSILTDELLNLPQVVREHVSLDPVSRGARFPSDRGQPAPHQHGARDVVSLNSGLSALALFNARKLLDLAVKLLNLPAQGARVLHVPRGLLDHVVHRRQDPCGQ